MFILVSYVECLLEHAVWWFERKCYVVKRMYVHTDFDVDVVLCIYIVHTLYECIACIPMRYVVWVQTNYFAYFALFSRLTAKRKLNKRSLTPTARKKKMLMLKTKRINKRRAKRIRTIPMTKRKSTRSKVQLLGWENLK